MVKEFFWFEYVYCIKNTFSRKFQIISRYIIVKIIEWSPSPPPKKNPTQILQVCSGSSTRVPLFIIIITNKTWNHFLILGSSFIIYIIQLIPQLQIHATSLLYSFWTAAQKHWLSNNCSIRCCIHSKCKFAKRFQVQKQRPNFACQKKIWIRYSYNKLDQPAFIF